MGLTGEWKNRIETWINELPNHFYKEIGSIDFDMFRTMQHLNINDVKNMKFEKVTSGFKWGRKWEYAWFKGVVILPEDTEGKRVIAFDGDV